MNFRIPAIAAAVLCCLSCVEMNYRLGDSLIPLDQTYEIFPMETAIPTSAISHQWADSLSGYSQTRITVGAIKDDVYGTTTRACALTLIPFNDTLDFGNKSAAKVRRMHFAAAFDTSSVADPGQEHILENLHVYPLAKYIDPAKNYDINDKTGIITPDKSRKIVKGSPVLNGRDSLSFDFTEEFASQYLDIVQSDLVSAEVFCKKFPGIYLCTDVPKNRGGRISCYELQLGYDSEYGAVLGDFAHLELSLDYDGDGVPEKDTTFYFLFGLSHFCDLDSLLEKGSRGNYPQYALNITGQDTRSLEAKATDKVLIEGGGGLKPVISAVELKHMAEDMITSKGGDPTTAVINKASLILPFEFPEDYKMMYKFPTMLSPTCRLRNDEGSIAYAGLTDASSSDENQGQIDRSNLVYKPDITYHIQELLKIHETPRPGDTKTDIKKRNMLLGGQYDIWFMIMADETTTTSSSSSSDLSDYYTYLAYQSYYNSMYGGYGGYGYGYGGYGGYGYDSYSNYYSYMMMAQYASGSSTTTSTSSVLDRDRYYCASLLGPAATGGRMPTFKLTFSLMNQ